MKRPLLAICAFGALAALWPAVASAAPVPIVQIAPEINGLNVDSAEYQALQARFNATTAALADATGRVASTGTELQNLQTEDARLTADLKIVTTKKKAATIELAQARAGLRSLAIGSYVDGPPEPDVSENLDVATAALAERALTQVVGERQGVKLQAATDNLDNAVHTMTADLTSRADGRVRITTVQGDHDRAVSDEARLGQDVIDQQDALERARVTANVVGEDFALVAIDAYWKAASAVSADDPECGIPWWALAGITRIESRHGTYGGAHLLANGDVDRRIVGIPLDGTNNTEQIADTDGGQYDGDSTYDRAVGPMQFIPQTWRRWAADGNGDGDKDPNNIYDAALAAAHYLCASGPMQTDDQMRRGFYSYNHSDSYANAVLSYAKSYARFQI